MNWEEWVDWKEKKYIAVGGFIIAYVLTIPWRNYESLIGGFVDVSQGVPLWAHLMIIVVGVIVLLVGLKVIEEVVKRVLRK